MVTHPYFDEYLTMYKYYKYLLDQRLLISMSSNLFRSKHFVKVILDNNKNLNKYMFSEANQSQIKPLQRFSSIFFVCH